MKIDAKISKRDVELNIKKLFASKSFQIRMEKMTFIPPSPALKD